MVDSRLNVINKRLAKIGKMIAVSSGKGGVGKSLIASTLALTLSRSGFKVGLLDLDFTSPSTHVILGIEGSYPKEEKGIIPPVAHGLMYMSIIYYSGDAPSPLRGVDISNAIIELLAITQWGSLDFLVIDMPPGIGDATLDMIRLVKDINFLVVTTSSKVVFETVRKLMELLKDLKVSIIGIIENMKMTDSSFIRENVEKHNLSFLGEIKFDHKLEDSMGNVNKLLETKFVKSLERIVSQKPEIKS
ncbi:MAG: Mrp/NBP35 family ATP-binding protein [Candidatus Bathyarchaeota archaeon]|nr:Mrp/NBP35 family ATP-binding protein [Candidatus Bathyarchaeota archaeon]MDH5495390.1 Mrp/NBP35 family ATP-binding protein [Candidatus Bathyarchaeota archaeon]